MVCEGRRRERTLGGTPSATPGTGVLPRGGMVRFVYIVRPFCFLAVEGNGRRPRTSVIFAAGVNRRAGRCGSPQPAFLVTHVTGPFKAGKMVAGGVGDGKRGVEAWSL